MLGVLSSCKLFSLILLTLLVSSSLKFCAVVAEDVPSDSLFNFVWDDSLRGYYIVSNKTFPLMVYVLSLSDVGNYRVSNHSAVVEGVKQAVKIRPGDSQVKELLIPLWGTDLVMKLNVNISYTMIEDWNTYKALVESGNNAIIVNTHDEYLPVPEDYTKEGWINKIADFMLNRWGTWVHAGGYPFYRIWYQNGTGEECGERGFQTLMGHINKGDVDCLPPSGYEEEKANLNLEGLHGLMSWYWWDGMMHAGCLNDFARASMGKPLKFNDFEDYLIMSLFSTTYESKKYWTAAIIHFSPNASTFNFGIYVHMGTWQFYDAEDRELSRFNDFATGFISTAAAIYCEFSHVAKELYGRVGDSAAESIQRARSEGRTIGLDEAIRMFQNALDAFASGNYKLARAYANQAKQTAEKAIAPNTALQIIAMVVTIVALISVGTYYRINNKKNRRENHN